jgi:hypothetical protein
MTLAQHGDEGETDGVALADDDVLDVLDDATTQ